MEEDKNVDKEEESAVSTAELETSASTNFELGALSSRYTAEIELEQLQRVSDSIESPSGAPASSPHISRDSFHNVDQSVNLMDANAGNYASEDNEEDVTNTGNQPADSGPQGFTFVEALMGETDDAKMEGSGWSKNPRHDNVRRTTWDTSICGRLTVWLVFLGTVVSVTFLIPFFLIPYALNYKNATKETTNTAATVTSNSAPATPTDSTIGDDSGSGNMIPISRMEGIKSVILQNAISSQASLDDKTSDAYYALRWLSETDPAQIEPLVNHHDNTELLQRYAMAVLYYATHPTVDADSHSQGAVPQPQKQVVALQPHKDDQEPDQQGLILPEEDDSDLRRAHLIGHELTTPKPLPANVSAEERDNDGDSYSSLTNPTLVKVKRDSERMLIRNLDGIEEEGSTLSGWRHDDKWMTSASVCDWYGVECQKSSPHDVIVQVNLTANQLEGTLPSELQALSVLTLLDVSKNKLKGEIPFMLWKKLHLMRSFLANDNFLEGSLKTEAGLLTNLRELDLSSNKFWGTLPITIGNLLQLKKLRIENNSFVGSIPPSVTLTELNVLRFGFNRFTGTIPFFIAFLRNLTDLGMQFNLLTGTFPPELDSLHALSILDLSHNRFYGELPEVFHRFDALETLNLDQNYFSGKLPTKIGDLTNLKSLTLSVNVLSGSIPTQWGGMKSLQKLSLYGNQISGTFPKEIGKLKKLTMLQIEATGLTGNLPDAVCSLPLLNNITMDCSQISCPLDCKACPCNEEEIDFFDGAL